MAFSNSAGCPAGWTRDQWMREVPRNKSTGQFVDDAIPCELPIAGYWACAALLIVARAFLAIMNITVLLSVKRARGKSRKRTRGLAPLFDILNTVFVILFVCLAPVTSSRNGTSWVLFGLSYTAYFIGSLFFIIKMIRNRRRMEGANGSNGITSMPKKYVRVRDSKWSLASLFICGIGLVGAPLTWIIGAAAFGGSVTCHRIAIGFFCLMTSVSQLIAFRESVLTAILLSAHVNNVVAARRTGAIASVRYKILRSAMAFFPVFLSSTALLLLLATEVIPFTWYLTYILLSMPVINAFFATMIFIRRKAGGGSSKDSPAHVKSGDRGQDIVKPADLQVASIPLSNPSLPPGNMSNAVVSLNPVSGAQIGD